MNGTHLHLLLNHFPIIGTLVACSLMGWALFKNNAALKNITAVLVIVLAAFAFVADQTGETAEHAMMDSFPKENRHAIHEVIEEHEHAAGPAMLAHMLAGLACIAYLVTERRKLPMAKNLFVAAFAITVVAFGLMARTGWLGGKIRHTELSAQSQIPGAQDEHNSEE